MRKEAYNITIIGTDDKTVNKWLKISEIDKLKSILRESNSVIIKSVFLNKNEYKLIFNT